MLSRVFTSSALLKLPSRVAQALNAIGLCAKVASILGVKPMFLVNAPRVGCDSAGTWSGFGTVLLGIMVSAIFLVLPTIRRVPALRPPAGAASAPSCQDAPARWTAA